MAPNWVILIYNLAKNIKTHPRKMRSPSFHVAHVCIVVQAAIINVIQSMKDWTTFLQDHILLPGLILKHT